jgi:hypothetical protein
MEGAPVSLILDVIVVVLLGLTIVYAARLSLQLRRLRDSKSDLDKVVRDLVKNLDRADRAISGLKEAARESGTDLQNAVDKAMALSDELQLITDSGDRLASRLESLVAAGRPLAAPLNTPQSAPTPKTIVEPSKSGADRRSGQDSQQANSPQGVQASYAQHLRKLDAGIVAPSNAPVSGGPFSIRDPDAERGIDPLDTAEDESLYSEAERDLFRAMKSRGRPR